MFHTHGLSSWVSPNIDNASFSVSNFSVFLPHPSSNLAAGSTWEIIPKVMGGASGEFLFSVICVFVYHLHLTCLI